MKAYEFLIILYVYTFSLTGGGVGGRGDTLNFSAYVGSGPASTLHPPPQKKKKNIRNFKHPKKIFEILATQKKYPHSVPWP